MSETAVGGRAVCLVCQQSEVELVSVAQLRTTLTVRPLMFVFTTVLAVKEEETSNGVAGTICLKCSELLDQIDALGLQLKLKTDELRTLYYNSREVLGRTVESGHPQVQASGGGGGVAVGRRPARRSAVRQCPCHQGLGVHKACAKNKIRLASAKINADLSLVLDSQSSALLTQDSLSSSEAQTLDKAATSPANCGAASVGDGPAPGVHTAEGLAKSRKSPTDGHAPEGGQGTNTTGAHDALVAPVADGHLPMDRSEDKNKVPDGPAVEGRNPREQAVAGSGQSGVDDGGGDGPADSQMPAVQCPDCGLEILGEETALGK